VETTTISITLTFNGWIPMSDKTDKKAGALHSELRIELHTQYAINTWSGRPASDGKPSLIGMPLFFRLISRINRDSLADNPWADVALVEVETLLETASQQLQKWLNEIDALMAMLPANASVSGVTSTAPLNIGVHSHTPLGYRCVYLLVGFDQLILRVFQAHHYGLMSLKERKAWLHRGSHQIRRIFSVALRYRSHPVTRQDIGTAMMCNAPGHFEKHFPRTEPVVCRTRERKYHFPF